MSTPQRRLSVYSGEHPDERMTVKRISLLFGACAMAASVLMAGSATADEPEFSFAYTTPVPGSTAAEACANSDNVIMAQVMVGGQVVEEFPLAEPGDMTRGGCVSTLNHQALTTSAYVANCKVLEGFFALENANGRPYPYAFYGNPDYTAKNRADCVYFLRGFHTGQLAGG